MESCFGGECPVEHTTNGPRTYLQPQLNKAVRRKDIDGDHVVFRAPKDWILWSSKDADCAPRSLRRDNTAASSSPAAGSPATTPSSPRRSCSNNAASFGGAAAAAVECKFCNNVNRYFVF